VTGTPLVILIPVYDDWEAVRLVLAELDRALSGGSHQAGVLLVDDGSVERPSERVAPAPLQSIEWIDVLVLRRNLGHQRAIAVGLTWVAEHLPGCPVVVMDGDGEDDPMDVPRLIAKFEAENGRKIIFAERTRRSESRLFRVLYVVYRGAHLVLSGHRVRVGNFSILPAEAVDRLVVVSELWSHYAAAVFHARLPRDTTPTVRGRRLVGRSRMDLVQLVTHGLGAISVFADSVGVRLLVATGLLIALVLALAAGVLVVRLTTVWAVPGWATYAMGLLAVMLLQAVTISFALVFLTLAGRTETRFLPLRDCPFFVADVRRVFSRGTSSARAGSGTA
jgi:hypothetical protein